MAAIAHAADTDPTRRGKFVRVQLLCETIPPPPPDVMAVPSTPDAGQTTRQHAVSQRGSGTCGGCHQFMDRIGFALENFDPTGRWRDSQNGQAIDASGEIVGTDVPGTLNGPAELGRKLGVERPGAALRGHAVVAVRQRTRRGDRRRLRAARASIKRSSPPAIGCAISCWRRSRTTDSATGRCSREAAVAADGAAGPRRHRDRAALA